MPGDNPVYGAPEDTTQSATNGTSTLDSNTAEFDKYETPNKTAVYETPVPGYATVGDKMGTEAYAVRDLNPQMHVPGNQHLYQKVET